MNWRLIPPLCHVFQYSVNGGLDKANVSDFPYLVWTLTLTLALAPWQEKKLHELADYPFLVSRFPVPSHRCPFWAPWTKRKNWPQWLTRERTWMTWPYLDHIYTYMTAQSEEHDELTHHEYKLLVRHIRIDHGTESWMKNLSIVKRNTKVGDYFQRFPL